MYTIVEIDKTSPYSGSFTPYAPYVYSTVVTVSPSSLYTSIASYWTDTFLADDEYNDVDKNVTGVIINITTQVPSVTSLADCLTSENSFYFDYDNQLLYVHLPHTFIPSASSLSTGVALGFSSDMVRYFRSQLYKPLLLSIPALSDKADPLEYGIISFGGGSIVLSNELDFDGDGFFDVDEKLYGNTVRIKRGDEGDEYDDLVLMFEGYIKDYTLTTRDFTIDLADKRERLQISYPTEVFTGLEGIFEDTNGKIIPDGYGTVIQAKAYPIEKDSTSVKFRWATVSTSITQLYHLKDEKLLEVGHGDWYLPSKDELDLLYDLHVAGLGGFSSTADYWSSTEVDASNAWRQYFGNGGQVSTAKSTSCRVRPVRAFTSDVTYAFGDPAPSGGFIFYASGTNYKECAYYDISSAVWATAITDASGYDLLIDEGIDGTFSLDNDSAFVDGDSSKGLREIFVTGIMRDITNPADIISDLNNRLVGIEYNSSNYDTTEWEAEKAYLSDVSLYMGETKKLYDWIQILQAGSNWGFRYEDIDKITLRRDDPDRTESATIPSIAIRNSDIPIKRNADFYASNIIVKYGKNERLNTYSEVKNDTYETSVLNEHLIKRINTYESLLTNSTDASEKALRIAQDITTIRPLVTLRIDSDVYPSPRIFDIISATVSLKTRGYRIPKLWSYVLGDDFVLGDDVVIGEQHGATYTDAYKFNDSERTYYGTLRGQVIGITWLPESDEVELLIRQRDATVI